MIFDPPAKQCSQTDYFNYKPIQIFVNKLTKKHLNWTMRAEIGSCCVTQGNSNLNALCLNIAYLVHESSRIICLLFFFATWSTREISPCKLCDVQMMCQVFVRHHSLDVWNEVFWNKIRIVSHYFRLAEHFEELKRCIFSSVFKTHLFWKKKVFFFSKIPLTRHYDLYFICFSKQIYSMYSFYECKICLWNLRLWFLHWVNKLIDLFAILSDLHEINGI